MATGEVTAVGRARAFSTTELPASERLALWEQVGLSCKTLDALRWRPPS
ncbi:hypothetical protein [Saccharopolyspora aridisoli]|nr:hypothetical protein [Saccharopolyspora aridisoli]